MTAAPAIKGWCPTLLSPMQSGDGWLARVKPTASTVTAEAARIVAGAASRHGNGHIDLTSRANLQLRGLTPRSAEQLAEIIIGAGLASANPAAEAVRNVMASPLGSDDATASFDAHASAREIESMLGAE
ncbi:MAG: precorrin-3B synthase, partial [Methyloceanibacter sp.]